jgi:predicted metalloprotease
MNIYVYKTYKAAQRIPSTSEYFSFKEEMEILKENDVKWTPMNDIDTKTFIQFNPLYLLFKKYVDRVRTLVKKPLRMDQQDKSFLCKTHNKGKSIISVKDGKHK